MTKLLSIIKNSNLIRRAYKLIFLCVGFFPVKRKLIIFESYLGKQYSCNPRAIYEYIKENFPEYHLIWSVDRKYNSTFIRNDILHIYRFSLKWLFLLPRASIWVTNSRMPAWIPKPSHTTYLQTWHGTPLKRLASDMKEVHMPGTNTENYKINFAKESKKWDFLISPNRYSTEIFKRAFSFSKEVIESGYPRNDYLVNNNTELIINSIKLKLGIPITRKVILYAPTWRDDEYHDKGKYKYNQALDLKEMKDKLGDNYIILMRMHYLIADRIDLQGLEDFVFDCSNYEDIRDLYLISDILITDYSSVFFDYSILKRPILFFVYDIDSYRDKLRGFYMDFELEAPGPLLRTNEEIINSINNIVDITKSYSSKYEAFYRMYCELEDGKASERVVKKIL